VLDRKQLEMLKSVDITTVDRKTLIDLSGIQIDTSQTTAEKMQSYFEQVQNPYCFLCGDTPVRIRFVSEHKTLTESVGNYFKSLK
jgi:hypothetical protein